jgi:Uncharacterised protein family (UPF0182)
MPQELQTHIRYPEDLFFIQAQLYRAYHMDTPEVFYTREDLCQFPRKQAAGEMAIKAPSCLCRPCISARKGVRSVPYPGQPQVRGCQSPHSRVRDGLRDPGSYGIRQRRDARELPPLQ